VAQLLVTAEEVSVIKLVGPAMFREARELVARGLVVRWPGSDDPELLLGEILPEPPPDRGQLSIAIAPAEPIFATVSIEEGRSGRVIDLRGTCSSGCADPCPHSVAVALTQISPLRPSVAPPDDQPKTERVPAWQQALTPFLAVRVAGPRLPQAELGLQFELVERVPSRYDRSPAATITRLALRPVMLSASGNWVRTGISWSNLSYARVRRTEDSARQLGLLRELLALRTAQERHYYGYSEGAIHVDDLRTPLIWEVLDQLRAAGLALLQPGKRCGPVVLHGRGQAALLAERTRAGLELTAKLEMEGLAPVPVGELLPLGPSGGYAWWDGPRTATQPLHLAWLSPDQAAQLDRARDLGRLKIPRQDEDRFFSDYYPELRQRIPVASRDPRVTLPELGRPHLVLAVEHRPDHTTAVSWLWSYPLGATHRSVPLWPMPGTPQERDADTEAAVTASVLDVVLAADAPGQLLEAHGVGYRVAPSAVLIGMATVAFIERTLPALAELADVEIAVTGTPSASGYRAAGEAPVIAFTDTPATSGDRDWFDLEVSVTIEGERVPFNALFLALAQQQSHLILPSGTYFSLDAEEFRRLAQLIEEARALQDGPPNALRLSRFQAGLWDELERIGVVSGQAAQWQASVRALRDAPGQRDLPAPSTLKADLRPYQLAGFTWLATLYSLGLGGILADDMGLGKTVQTLALFCHLRETGSGQAPFLVVAPTSVASNWAHEAAAFAPDLRVAVITETQRRSGADLAAIAAEADVVVTSYALFRIEYDRYAEIGWAGMVLDEAQFVKNHQGATYQCARKLATPFKLAITGTPMENNLMELWSLLSITAPGLFAHPTRFTDYYRTPIEKEKDAERLAQLRTRIRPLMLRRTKDQVVRDLPDKQEQVVELELNAMHQKVYQTYLNRERQKVLGLIGDFEKNRFEIFRSLTLLRQASLDVGLIDPKHAAVPSTKLDAMMDLLSDAVAEGHRTLIFSQFTRFLTAARDRLDAAGIEHCYLDGTTRRRAAVIERFRAGTAPVFLISLKAGGFGLNLTEADYCILLDPWWNPATEAQAVDRVHRIGQTKKVMVYRLVSSGTIEEKVMALKAGKAALFASVMDGGGFESASLGAADIRALLE
jgi:superfamily II DNA or RNA helicase